MSSAFAVLALSTVAGTLAQPASESAVPAADGAFGSSIGRESIGLYTASSVRGFSANAAGDTCIAGLYVDPVRSPSRRLRLASSTQVGLSAQGFAFPASMGMVDCSLLGADAQAIRSFCASGDSLGPGVVEFNANLPASEEFSFGAGPGLYRTSFAKGTAGNQNLDGFTARWRPGTTLEVQPFWSRSDAREDEYSFDLRSSGALDRIPGRVFTPFFAIDL